MSGVSTLVHLLRAHAERHSERWLYRFLAEGETEVDLLTYGELERRARAIGARLQERQARGERALLLYPPGLEFITAFFGCAFGGAVAVPAYPPHGTRSLPRLSSIVADARPRFILTTAALLPRIQSWAEQDPEAGIEVVATDLLTGGEAAWRDPGVGPEDLAFLQYTSGSTGTPKGVMVTHGGLLHNEEMIRRAFGMSESSLVVSWLPLYHDMGLVGGLLQPLYAGAQAVLMSPTAFLQRSGRWSSPGSG